VLLALSGPNLPGCSIIGTTTPAHVRANLDAAAGPPLPIEDVQAIRRAFLEAEAAAGGHWPGLT